MLDRLTLTGLRAFAHHGVYDFEREQGQPFVIDVVVHLDLSQAGAGDALADTIHYGELAEDIVAAVERDPVDLIETVAERVARLVLSRRPARAVDVTVHKPEAPIPVPFSDVSVTIHRRRTMAIIAVGSNLGDREGTIRQAVLGIAAHPAIRLIEASPLVETAAVKLDGVDETAPRYLNAVLRVETTLSAPALLAELHRIEDAHGRTREERWGDRTLDLDIIVFGDARSDEPRLTLPHPRAHERAFVLAPWAAIDEDAVIPGRGRVVDLLSQVLEYSDDEVRPYPAEPLA